MSRIPTPSSIDTSPAAAQPLLAAVKGQLGAVPNNTALATEVDFPSSRAARGALTPATTHAPEATIMIRPPVPPFTAETARQKARMAEDAWNTREPERVALAYTEDSRWRNRAEFLNGRAAIVAFLTRKWERELDYRLIKEVWAFTGARIAVRFAYEFHDEAGHWFRAYGNEQWEFDEHGLMRRREASINDLAIPEADRRFHWPLGALPARITRGSPSWASDPTLARSDTVSDVLAISSDVAFWRRR